MELKRKRFSTYKNENCLICDIDKSVISTYECVSFVIKIINRNDSTIYNINLKNIFSNSFSYVLRSFSINGIYISNVDIKSINIDEMFKDEEIIIRFTLKAVDSFNKEVIKTVFSYSNDNYSDYRKSEIIYSNIIQRKKIQKNKLAIREDKSKYRKFDSKNKESLKISETLDKKELLIGDIVSINLNIKNISNNLVEDIEIIDILDESLELLSEEIFIENEKLDSYKLTTGIKIKDIKTFTEVSIKFRAKVIKKIDANIKNIIRVNYKEENKSYLIEKESYNKLNVYYIDIDINKSSNKDKVILGDVIKFKLNISNLGNVDCYNLNIQDDLSECLEFEKGSIYIGSDNIKQASIDKGINIARIKSGEAIAIYYKAKIKKIIGGGIIKTTLNGSFKYKYGGKRLLEEKEIDKLVYTIKGKNPIFTEFNLESYIDINNNNNFKEIIDTNSTIDIKEFYVVKTVKGVTSDNFILTGNKLVVSGILNINLEYSCADIEEKCYVCTHNEKFLVDIMLPEDYNDVSSIDIKQSSNIIYSKIINKTRALCISSIFIQGILYN